MDSTRPWPSDPARSEPHLGWVVGDATATIVAVSDGSASIYLSNGGGYLGGGGHESIRNAASKMVEAAGGGEQYSEHSIS